MKNNPISYLFCVLLFLAISMQNLSATTYEVNNNGDYSPLPSVAATPIMGTLRWAVEQADMNAGPDTIVFNLTFPAVITLFSGYPIFLIDDLVIKGPGKDNLTISGNNTTRHFWAQNGNIHISGLTLVNGLARGGNGAGGGMGAGGSIFMHEGSKGAPGALTLNITDVNFENNQAIGGSATSFGDGGGGLGGNGGVNNTYGGGGGGVYGNGGSPFFGMTGIYYGGGGGSFENGQNAQDGAVGIGGLGNDLFGNGGVGAEYSFTDGCTSFPCPVGAGGFGGGGGGIPSPNAGPGGVGGFGGGGGAALVGANGGFGGGGGAGNSGGFGGNGGFGGGGGIGSGSKSESGFGGGEGTSNIAGYGGMGAGGAIFVTTGSLTLKNVNFSMNSSLGGNGYLPYLPEGIGKGHGGAIFVFEHARFSDEVTNQITPWGFTNASSVSACCVTFDNNTASTPDEEDNDVFGPISLNPISCFETTGRDTSICPGELVDLETLINGCYTRLYYGTSFGSYPNEIGQVSPTDTTTYYIADSLDGSLADTAQITINVVPQPSITGRDTTVCMDAMVDLSTLITGTPVNTPLEYGTDFGTYGGPSIIQATETETYFVRDSSVAAGCVDTAEIKVTVLNTEECLMTFTSSNILFADPCNCDAVERAEGLYYFKDTLIITDVPPGNTILFSNVGAQDFYSAPGVEMADGTLIQEGPSGTHKLVFYKLSNAQAAGSVTLNGGDPFPIPEAALEFCYVNVDCPALIPTMGQWGLIVLSLLLLIIGLGFIKVLRRSTSLVR